MIIVPVSQEPKLWEERQALSRIRPYGIAPTNHIGRKRVIG